MKRNILFAIALLVTMNVAAQTTKDVYVGYSRVMDYIKSGSKSDTGYGDGVEVGINFIRPISKPFALTYGIQGMYGWSNGSEPSINMTEKTKFIKFLVPVSLLCEIRSSSGKFAVEPFAGVNTSFYALGKSKLNGKTYDWFDGKDSFDLTRLQFGWHVGANFVYDRYMVTLNYQQDFTDVRGSNGKYYGGSIHWANMELRFGYRF